MIDKILTEALERIEQEQVSNPEDYKDVQEELDNLKIRMKEFKDFLLFPTLEQLENIDKEKDVTKRGD